MSNYFQVLKKIERDRSGQRPGTPEDAAAAAEHAAPDAAETPASAPRPLRALSTAPSSAAVPPAVATTPQIVPAAPSTTPTPSLATIRPAPRVDLAARQEQRPEPAARPEARNVPHRPATRLSEESQRGIATLFDTIRAMANSRATRTLVFAGAAASDSVHSVSEGLVQHAEKHGMRAFVAELRPGANGPTLVPRTGAETFDVDVNGGAAPGELSAWVDRVAVGSDLVILEGPPLADSIDAALLACACDGLVIVADAEVTPRAALHKAAERAQISGCRTLGVVMTGTKERMPSWMRRLLGSDDRAPGRGNA